MKKELNFDSFKKSVSKSDVLDYLIIGGVIENPGATTKGSSSKDSSK